MQLGYDVVATIDRPTPIIVEVLKSTGLKPHKLRTGAIVTRLRRDNELSARLTTDGQLLSAYCIPEILGERARYRLQANEVGRLGHYAYVVTGYKGGPLKCREVSASPKASDWHVFARFAGEAIGRVAWHFLNGYEPARQVLTIDRARLEIEGDTAVVKRETPMPLFGPAPILPTKLSAWQPAVTALHERLHCTNCNEVHFSA